MIVCFGAFIGLISRTCNAVELTLVFGGINPLVVVDRLGAITVRVVIPAKCWDKISTYA